MRRSIFGEKISQLGINSEQVTNGVFILDAIEPPQNDASVTRAALLLRARQLFPDQIRGGADFLDRRPRLLFWRHRSGLELIEHGSPEIAVFRLRERELQLVQPQVSLRLRAAVTFHAVPLEKRRELFSRLSGGRVRNGGGDERCGSDRASQRRGLDRGRSKDRMEKVEVASRHAQEKTANRCAILRKSQDDATQDDANRSSARRRT